MSDTPPPCREGRSRIIRSVVSILFSGTPDPCATIFIYVLLYLGCRVSRRKYSGKELMPYRYKRRQPLAAFLVLLTFAWVLPV